MARRPGAQAIYDVADSYRQLSFTGGKSLLFPERELWTANLLHALADTILKTPDEGDRGFLAKLKDQLAPLPDDATVLAAEGIGFCYLFTAKVTPETKARKVAEILSWRSGNPSAATALEAAFEAQGIGGPGTHYSTSIPWQFAYILKFAEITQIEHADLKDPGTCRGVADRALREVPQAGESRNIVLHLLHPDRFDRVVSKSHRELILRAFAGLTGNATNPDDALANIRGALAREYGREDIDFYDAPIAARWKAGEGGEIRDTLGAILRAYIGSRTGEPFNHDSTTYQLFKRIEAQLAKSDPVAGRRHVRVKASPGQGNWAAVPWISLLDDRVTDSTQRGVYCVYLFREDMTGVYLTFNQGVTDLTRKEGVRTAAETLRKTAADLRQRFPSLSEDGFRLDDDIDLRTQGGLGGAYEVSTIAYKLYDAPELPPEDDLLSDLDHVLSAYDEYARAQAPERPVKNYWVFQANPDRYDLSAAISQRSEMAWLALQRPGEMGIGDRVFMWESGANAGVTGLGTIVRGPTEAPFPADEKVFSRDAEKFEGLQSRVRLRIDGAVSPRIGKAELEANPTLRELAIVRAPRMTNYILTEEQGRMLEALALQRVRSGTPSPVPATPGRKDLGAIAGSFAASLQRSHLSFGTNLTRIARSFVASLATKPFVILTGLSGSGKTQIAARFGDWLGKGRSLVVAVRPDWTGSDALFGYEDALQRPAQDGRRAWFVPEVLSFLLEAATNPDWPYLLVLDEMNLAHVERYFADVLSGMETGSPCLPNLVREDGFWRQKRTEASKIAFPRNAFVVGTVNVDETTYLFSPKVLDRANTFEFRVATEDLSTTIQRPIPTEQGDAELIRGLLEIAIDDSWHLSHPADGIAAFTEKLQLLHRLLLAGGFEFGHRVFYEAVRFAAIYSATGERDPMSALDLQIMQKVLPRLHGSRRRLEGVLCGLGQFCYDLLFDEAEGLRDAVARFDPLQERPGSARLPISFDKVARMTSLVRANQFVSFTE